MIKVHTIANDQDKEKILQARKQKRLDENDLAECEYCKKEFPIEDDHGDMECGISMCPECHEKWMEDVRKCPHINIEENEQDPGTGVCMDCLSGGHKLPVKDIDYEAKQHHGSYADDDREEE